MTTTIRIRNTEDAVATIAALVTRSIAADNRPGHDLETVGNRMTADPILDLIRTAYEHRINVKGDTPKDAVTKVGTRLIAEYFRQFNLN